MPTTPKLLTFQPILSKKDSIEFWDYPESLESIASEINKKKEDKGYIKRLPNYKILIKTKLDKYPEHIRTESKTDLTLKMMFYSFCDTEQIINFDGLPFHLVFYKGFEDYLKKEYKLGDDIYLYLVFLFGSNGKQYYYVRDFSLKSPEQQFNDKLEIINTTKKK